MTDLVVLAADKNIEAGVAAILRRHESLGCREIAYKTFVHPNRDPGCYGRSGAFLQGFTGQFSRALVVFDLDGSGSKTDRASTEAEVEVRLIQSGWEHGHAACIVVDPEIENWVWSDSPRVPQVLGWNADEQLRDTLQAEGLWPAEAAKPLRPKETLETVLRRLRRPRSSAIYADLGAAVGLGRCSDPAFAKLRNVLHQWFPTA